MGNGEDIVYISSLCKRYCEDCVDNIRCPADAGDLIKTYKPLRSVVIKLLSAGFKIFSALSKCRVRSENGEIKGFLSIMIELEANYSDILPSILPDGFEAKSESERIYDRLPYTTIGGGDRYIERCPDYIKFYTECVEPKNIRRIEQEAIQTLEDWLTDDFIHAVYAMLTLLNRV